MSEAESWDDLTADERNALLELARARANGSITRRDALIGGGAVLAGVSIGGGASQAVGTAAADASPSDGDGDIGTPSNRVDAFLEGVDANSVDTDHIGNTRFIYQGENAQSVLDGLPVADYQNMNVVFMDGRGQFDHIDIPAYTHVFVNGAMLKPSTDIPCININAEGAWAYGPGTLETFQVTGYSSGAIQVDTAGLANRLQIQNRNCVGAMGFLATLAPGAGAGLRLISTDQDISVGNQFALRARQGAQSVDIQTNNGNFINGVDIELHSENADGEAILHRNTVGAQAAGWVFAHGTIQPSGSTSLDTTLLRNTTTSDSSIEFRGQLWDTPAVTTSIDGPGIRVQTENRIDVSTVNFGAQTTINGVGRKALAGEHPDATNWRLGDTVIDSDYPGNVYEIYDDNIADGWTQKAADRTPTTGIGATATDIYHAGKGGGAFIVRGFEQGSSVVTFTDYVLWGRNNGGTAIGTIENNTPAARTYGRNADFLTLSMGSGTYDVTTTGLNIIEP